MSFPDAPDTGRKTRPGGRSPAKTITTYGQVLEVQTDKDLYGLLGLPEMALQDDIRKAH